MHVLASHALYGLYSKVVLTLEWLVGQLCFRAGPDARVPDSHFWFILIHGVVSRFSGFPGIETKTQLHSSSEMASGTQLGSGRWEGGQGCWWMATRQSDLSLHANVLHPIDSQPQTHPSVLCSVMLSRETEASLLIFFPQRTSSLVLPVRGTGRKLGGQWRKREPLPDPSSCQHLCINSVSYSPAPLAAQASAM